MVVYVSEAPNEVDMEIGWRCNLSEQVALLTYISVFARSIELFYI